MFLKHMTCIWEETTTCSVCLKQIICIGPAKNKAQIELFTYEGAFTFQKMVKQYNYEYHGGVLSQIIMSCILAGGWNLTAFYYRRESGCYTHAMACGAGTGVFLSIRVWLFSFFGLNSIYHFMHVHFASSLLYLSAYYLFMGMITGVGADRGQQFCYKDVHGSLLGHLLIWMHLVKR